MTSLCLSFCKTLSRSHVSDRYRFALPKNFADKHMPRHDSVVVLVDEREHEYDVLFSRSREDQFTRGWKDFVTAHGLLEEDALAFHLIDTCKFKVRIIRAIRAIKAEPQDDEPLDSVERKALQSSVNEEMVPAIKNVYVRRKWKSIQACDSPCDGEVTRTVRKEQCVTEQSSQCAIENSKAALSFQDINGFEEFKIYVNGEMLDSDLPTDIRLKYYQLCCVQKKLLHEHLIGGVNTKSVVEMILEITSIADAMVGISISTPVHDLDRMDRTLQSFEEKGMAVGHLRTNIPKLIKLSREYQTVEESSRDNPEEIERERKVFMDRKAKIDELIDRAMAHGKFIGQLEANLDAQKKKMADLSVMFKVVTDRMKCNSGTRPSRNKRSPYSANDYL